MIPKVINYIHIDLSDSSSANIPLYNKLCIYSAVQSNPDYKIRIYSNKFIDDFDNENIEKIIISPLWFYVINEIGITKVAHMADFLRYKILYEKGGIYSDTDILIVKSLDDLLDYDLVVSKQSRRQICNGFIMCSKHNLAIKDTYDNYYNDYKSDKWTYNSMVYLYDRIKYYEDNSFDKINVIDKENEGFHYPHFNNLIDIMSSGLGCENCYAHHLWNSSPQGRIVRRYIENHDSQSSDDLKFKYLDSIIDNIKLIVQEDKHNDKN